MAVFKDLTSGTMVHITGAWLDIGRTRPLLEKMKRVAPLLEDVEGAHAGVVRSHQKETAAVDALGAIQAEQLDVDRRHDRKARGSFNLLGALVELAESPEQAAAYRHVLDVLFPEGLRILTATYADEAGRARVVRGRLTPEIKATLKAIPSPDGTLLKSVLAWLDAGDALGALEERRAKLEAAAARSKETTGAGSALRARNRWISVVRAVIDMIELESPEPPVRDEVLGPLERALAQAAKRNGASKGTGAPAADGTSPTGDGATPEKNAPAAGITTSDATPA